MDNFMRAVICVVVWIACICVLQMHLNLSSQDAIMNAFPSKLNGRRRLLTAEQSDSRVESEMGSSQLAAALEDERELSLLRKHDQIAQKENKRKFDRIAEDLQAVKTKLSVNENDFKELKAKREQKQKEWLELSATSEEEKVALKGSNIVGEKQQQHDQIVGELDDVKAKLRNSLSELDTDLKKTQNKINLYRKQKILYHKQLESIIKLEEADQRLTRDMNVFVNMGNVHSSAWDPETGCEWHQTIQLGETFDSQLFVATFHDGSFPTEIALSRVSFVGTEHSTPNCEMKVFLGVNEVCSRSAVGTENGETHRAQTRPIGHEICDLRLEKQPGLDQRLQVQGEEERGETDETSKKKPKAKDEEEKENNMKDCHQCKDVSIDVLELAQSLQIQNPQDINKFCFIVRRYAVEELDDQCEVNVHISLTRPPTSNNKMISCPEPGQPTNQAEREQLETEEANALKKKAEDAKKSKKGNKNFAMRNVTIFWSLFTVALCFIAGFVGVFCIL